MAGYKRSTVMPLKRNEDKLKCQWGGTFAYYQRPDIEGL